MAVRFGYHRYWPARGIAEKSSLQIVKEQDRQGKHAASPNKKRILTASWPLARDHMNLDGFVKQPRHISEQCALLYVSRGVVVSIEVLTLTIDSRCVDENSDFLSMFEIAESAKMANHART